MGKRTMDYHSPELTHRSYNAMYKALKVILLTKHIREYLLEHDPYAYEQVRGANTEGDFGRYW